MPKLSDLSEREQIIYLKSAIKDAVFVLNQIPNTKIKSVDFEDTYEFIPYLENLLKDIYWDDGVS